MCEEAKKKVKGNNTVQKLAPLCASSSPVSLRFLDMLHSCLTEQQTGQAPSAFSLLSHPSHHLPSRHWSRRMSAILSSPRRIVTYGNAEDGDPRYNQVGGANSSAHRDTQRAIKNKWNKPNISNNTQKATQYYKAVKQSISTVPTISELVSVWSI